MTVDKFLEYYDALEKTRAFQDQVSSEGHDLMAVKVVDSEEE